MKKSILFAALLMAIVPMVNAQKSNAPKKGKNAKKAQVTYVPSTGSIKNMVSNKAYSRLSLSYDLTSISDIDNACSLNGVGLHYNYGFEVYDNAFVETGLNLNYQVGSNRYYNYSFSAMQLPVNIVYRLNNVVDNVTLMPYAGINFKLNLLGSGELSVNDVSLKKNLFSSDDMGGSAYTYNRFQPGWHIGCGANYGDYYLGAEFGTDFRSLYDEGENDLKTSNFRLSIGYNF